MPARRHRWICLTFTGVLLHSAAWAGAPEEEAQRLDDLRFYVRSLQRGWRPLVEEARAAAEAVGELPAEAARPVLDQRDAILTERADLLLAGQDERDEPEVLALSRELAERSPSDERRAASRGRIADVSVRVGGRLEAKGDEDGAYAAYAEAVRAAPDRETGYVKVVDLGARQVARMEEAQEYDDALGRLDEVLALVDAGPAGVRASGDPARARKQAILAGTGVVTIRLIGDPVRLAAVRDSRLGGLGRVDLTRGQVALAALDGGKAPPPLSAAAPRRIRTGRFRVECGPPDARLGSEVAVPASGATISLPAVVPAGMTWVRSAGGGASFLCDLFEVPNVDYAAFAAEQGGASSGGDARAAASGVPLADARRYARWSGKELPTLDQWTHAAFGSPRAAQPRYPWGDAEGRPGRQFVGDASGPGPVDSCPAGRSQATGVWNMAGNVAEWLADGWFIGGSYVFATLRLDVAYANPVGGQPTWSADLLRDPVPTPEIYAGSSMSNEERNRHAEYRVTDDAAATFVRQVGLRCVVPLE